MNKPGEWWIRPEASYSREFVWPIDYEYMADADDKIHVIEYSAYKDIEEQLLAMKARFPMSKSKEPGGWARDFHGETHVIEYSAYLSAIRERDEARAEIAGSGRGRYWTIRHEAERALADERARSAKLVQALKRIAEGGKLSNECGQEHTRRIFQRYSCKV